jgi:ribosome-associated translation inhibitor RaiA
MSIPIELHLDHVKISEQLESKLKKKINDWERGHRDITGAYVSLKQLSGKPTVHEYEAKIVLYHRPENVVATHRSSSIPDALTGAAQTAERLLRRQRESFRDRRKRARTEFVEPIVDTPIVDLPIE